jgi:Trk-type K+ transport system membrane component
MDESKKWFDMWHILFDTVSATRNIGLSLGVPDVSFFFSSRSPLEFMPMDVMQDNYSFAGAMSWQGKIVLCIVM